MVSMEELFGPRQLFRKETTFTTLKTIEQVCLVKSSEASFSSMSESRHFISIPSSFHMQRCHIDLRLILHRNDRCRISAIL